MGHVIRSMIYEDSFREAVSAYLQCTKDRYNKYVIRDVSGFSIVQLIEERERLKMILAQLENDKPAEFSFDVEQELQNHFAPMISDYDNHLRIIHSNFENGILMLKNARANAIADAEDVANQDIMPLIEKHNELMSYKDKLSDVLLRYNITPSDIKISSDITREEFEAVLDTAIEGCRALIKSRNTSIVSFLKNLTDTTKSNDKALHLAGLIVGVYVFAPLFLAWLFGYMFLNTGRIYKRLDKLRIAESLMYDIDFTKFLSTQSIEDIPEIDTTELEAERDRQLKEMMDKDPRIKLDEERKSFAANITQMSDSFKLATMRAMETYTQKLANVKTSYEGVKAAIDAYMVNIKEFGSFINSKPVFDTSFTLGKMSGTIDMRYKLPLTNIAFNETAPNMIDFVKLMLANAILAVKEKCLYTTIYDPGNLGAEFSEFFTLQTAEFLDVKTKDLEVIVKDLRDYAQENIKIIGKKSINEYNEEAYAVGKVTRDYKLLVILSDAKKALDMAGFAKFMEYSAQYGVMIWILSSTPIQGVLMYNTPYNDVEQPLLVTPELLATVMETYTQAVENSKADSIDYIKGFQEKYIPEEKYWSFSTNKGIALHFGLENGDPTKGYPLFLGDGNVHSLMAGATGAGKSAAINQILASLLRMYSPEELELVMVDFKNVEFAMYTDKKTGKSRIPHAKIIAGTKDGEYALSVFDYLLKEMDRRTAIFAKSGVKKLEDYNNKMRANGTSELCMPRILVLIDEFQVMFTEVDPKSVDKISQAITSLSKLARFCGCHMWFTSQSMKGTLAKDIMDQFSLRAALRCAKDVSTSIIGGPQAGTIKTKFGYMYTNTSAGEDQSTTVLWRVPFASDKVVEDTMTLLEGLREKHGSLDRGAIFYDENKRHYQKELLDLFEVNRGFETNPRLMILGERTGFSLNRAPINFNFTVDDGEHLAAIAFEREDLLNFCMSVIDNVKSKKDAKLIIHSADKDTFTLLEVEKYLEPEVVEMSRPTFEFEYWLDTLEDLINARKEKPVSDLSPIFFLAIQWEKYRGVGREEKYAFTERLKKILQEAPMVDIHFIFASKSAKEIPSVCLNNCNHRIAMKCDEQESYKMIASAKAFKLPEVLGFGIYSYGSSLQKFKLYQHTFSRQLEKREITL